MARRLGQAGMGGDRFRLGTVDNALLGADGRIWQVAVTKAEAVAYEGCDAVKALMAWEDDLSSRARTLPVSSATSGPAGILMPSWLFSWTWNR